MTAPGTWRHDLYQPWLSTLGSYRSPFSVTAEAMCSSQLQAVEGNRLGPLATKMHQATRPFCTGEFSPAVTPALCLGMWDCTTPGLPQPAEPDMTVWWVLKKGKLFNYPASRAELVDRSCCPGFLQQGREISYSPQCCCDRP